MPDQLRIGIRTTLLLLFAISTTTYAQPALIWELTIDACADGVAIAQVGSGWILAGNRLDAEAAGDVACIVGVSEDGTVLWTTELAPPDPYETITVTSVTLSPVGVVAAGWVGYIRDSLNGGLAAGFVAEVASNGTPHWLQIYPHEGRDAYIHSIRYAFGGYVVAAQVDDRQLGGSVGLLAQIEYDGKESWRQVVAKEGYAVQLDDISVRGGRDVLAVGTKRERGTEASAGVVLVRVDWRGDVETLYEPATVDPTRGPVSIAHRGDDRAFVLVNDLEDAASTETAVHIYGINTENEEPEWKAVYSDVNARETVAVAATAAPDYGLYMSGFQRSDSPRGQDAVLTRFDASGTRIWEHAHGEPTARERFDDVVGAADGTIAAVGTRDACATMPCNAMFVAVFKEDVSAETFFPLSVGNTWKYTAHVLGPTREIDTLFFDPYVVEATATVDDTLYYLAPYPIGTSDTLRADSRGRISGRRHGRDFMLFDFTRLDGAMYFVGASHAGTSWSNPYYYYTWFYPVTVWRGRIEEVPAGIFEDVVHFDFNIPQARDDEASYSFAPEIGPIYSSGVWIGNRLLYEATVNGKVITSHVEMNPGQRLHVVAYPNPASSSVSIEIEHPSVTYDLSVLLVDVLGRRIATLWSGRCEYRCTASWDAEGVSSGVYYIRVESPAGTRSVPIVVNK